MLRNKNNKRSQTFDGVTKYPYKTSAFKVCKSEIMVVINFFVEKYVDYPLYGETILQRKYKRLQQNIIINFHDYVNKKKTEHNLNWLRTDHPYIMLIIGSSGSGKTNVLLNLIDNHPDIDKIYLYAKGPYEAKYQYLTNIPEKVGIDNFDDPKAFIEYSNDMHVVYKNIDDYNRINNVKY